MAASPFFNGFAGKGCGVASAGPRLSEAKLGSEQCLPLRGKQPHERVREANWRRSLCAAKRPALCLRANGRFPSRRGRTMFAPTIRGPPKKKTPAAQTARRAFPVQKRAYLIKANRGYRFSWLPAFWRSACGRRKPAPPPLRPEWQSRCTRPHRSRWNRRTSR